MTADDFIKAHLASVAHYNAHQYGANAMLGVMLVIRRRVQVGWYEGSWMNNIYHAVPMAPLSTPDPREPAFQKILQLADSVYDGTLEDKWTGGALSFKDQEIPTAPYAGLERVAKIDQLNFYK